MGKEQMKKKGDKQQKVAKLMQKLGECRWWTSKILDKVIKCK